MADRKSDKRHGWFVDFGAEYTGLDVVTPQVFAWWSTGEDKSTGNGSERMPYVRSAWGPGNSFLFDNGQELNHGGANMTTPPSTAAMDWTRMSRLRICPISWASTPRSSSGDSTRKMPSVTATTPCSGLRPVAKALGASWGTIMLYIYLRYYLLAR